MTDPNSPRTFRALVEEMLPRWRVIGFTALVILTISILIVATTHRTYTATAAFMSQTRRSASGGFSSIAAQLGVGIEDSGGESPQFYVDLILRQSNLRALVDSPYPSSSGKGYRNLVDFFGVSGGNYPIRRDRAVTRLRTLLDATGNAKTGVVTIDVTSEDPILARALADRIIALVNDFNLQRRKSQAAAERDFVEQRLEQAMGELRAAENRQEQFLQTNAVVRSPRLQLEAERLTQEVSTRRAVFTALSQSYEQAKIDAVRDTPVITVIESPIVPAEPNSKGLARAIVLGLLGGLLMGILVAYWMTSWGRAVTVRDSV